MRKVLLVFLCTLSIAAHAADYFVSSSGSDSANGLSSTTPWQSISKINSVFSTFKPGDRILFKRGDRFYGSLKISGSGSAGSPITISAYGTGASPVISGFTTISGWTNYGGGIYSKAISCQSRPNMVTVNDVNTPIGRWPNSGFLFIDSHVSNTSITDSDLPSSPDWTGAEVVIRKNEYIWDRNKITDHTGTTIQYSSGSGYSAINGYGYFLQNSLNTLDQPGEWYYDGSTFYMYFGTANPDSYVVKVSSIDQLVSLPDKNYITFDNIAFEGANLYAIQINNSDYVTIQNCVIKFTGTTAVYGPYNGSSPYCKITNNSISNSNNSAIKLMGDHTNATVTNNIITKTGLIIGMGESGDATYNALVAYGSGSLVQYNVIENTGYIGIHFSGDNTVVSNNYVNKYNLVKNDGGGIYTYVGTGIPRSGQKVINNIVLNGSGYADGEPDKAFIAHGIYMDDRVRNVIVTGNTVANCSTSGIYIHNAHEIEITKNTLFDNGSGNSDYGAQILFTHDSYSPDDPIRNLNISNNIFFARNSSQKILAFSTTSNDITSFGSADYNCYAKPVDNAYIARTWSGGWNSAATNYSLSNWQQYTGKDKSSFTSPVVLTDGGRIRFEYNASNSNKSVSLDGSYIDVKGTKYSGTITLSPYSSVVLIPDPNPPAPPPIPAYVSSAIENASPAVIIINYSLMLAGIIPAASAFTVKVNSTARSVTAVSVSGTRISLTLSSAVVYGNTVTVAYTKPAANPVQTTLGGQAATFGPQTVTNKVVAVSAPQAVAAPQVVANTPPVAVVNYTSTSNSGFISELNASGSYDPNNDNLTFTWSVPGNVSVSSTSGSKIKFLSPIVYESQLVEFTLKISDGKTTQIKVIPIEILPYGQELEVAEIANIEASGFQPPYYPHNIIDGDIGTMWSANGENQWIIFELKEPFNIRHVKLAFKPGQSRESYFEILGSEDKITWEPILTKSASCAFSSSLQVFDIPPSKTEKEYNYVKLIGRGNSQDTWNYVSEFKIFGYGHRNPVSYEEQPVKIYPNPASAFINILIEDPAMIPDFIRIVNLSGKIVFEDKIDPGAKEFRVPIDLIRGIYIIQMGTGNLTLFTQKLVVNR